MRRRRVKRCHSEYRGRQGEGGKMRNRGGREENQIGEPDRVKKRQ